MVSRTAARAASESFFVIPVFSAILATTAAFLTVSTSSFLVAERDVVKDGAVLLDRYTGPKAAEGAARRAVAARIRVADLILLVLFVFVIRIMITMLRAMI